MSFVKGDVGQAQEPIWQGMKLGVVPTPGRTRGALTYLAVWDGKAIAFCGDAAHSGGTVYQPYHLEWDHWTAEGALAAWYGLERLGSCRVDLLCPGHGPVVGKQPGKCIREAQRRVMAFVKAKGSVCSGEMDRWAEVELLDCGAFRVLPNLYNIGGNSYLLAGKDGEGMMVDPTQQSVKMLPDVMAEVGVENITAATASHYHSDHTNGLNLVREEYDSAVWLHPWVAEPIRDRDVLDVPWLPNEDIKPDRTLPEEGRFLWGGYRFHIRPYPGQTWWHCAFDAEISGQHVLFSGDNFQPPSRWNGTGGFCAFNGGKFRDGFSRSAQIALDLSPDLICNGHGCIYRFHRGHYKRILKWSEQAEQVVRKLCSSVHWSTEYDFRVMRWEPFRTAVKPGGKVNLKFQVENNGGESKSMLVTIALPAGWKATPAQRKFQVTKGKPRSAGFQIRVPRGTAPGRYVISGDVISDSVPIGENAVALIDVGEGKRG